MKNGWGSVVLRTLSPTHLGPKELLQLGLSVLPHTYSMQLNAFMHAPCCIHACSMLHPCMLHAASILGPDVSYMHCIMLGFTAFGIQYASYMLCWPFCSSLATLYASFMLMQGLSLLSGSYTSCMLMLALELPLAALHTSL